MGILWAESSNAECSAVHGTVPRNEELTCSKRPLRNTEPNSANKGYVLTDSELRTRLAHNDNKC